MLPKEGKLLRIIIGESDKRHGIPLYDWIVREARKTGLAGASVFRGIQGFGAKSHMHTAKILCLSQDMPILIEIIDVEEKIDSFVEIIDPVIKEGIVTIENVEVRFCRGNR